MKTTTILLSGALALAAVGVASAAVTTCPTPKKAVHQVAAHHVRPRAVTRRAQVLAAAAEPSYAARYRPEYVETAYPPPVYEVESYPAYYPAPYAYGPVVYGYGGPYWGDRWGHGWHGGWRGGHWRR